MQHYKAEMWDKMQHTMEKYNDHMIHCYLEFETELDFEALKKAFFNAVLKIPVLRSRYEWNFFRARWTQRYFNIKDCVKLLEVKSNPERPCQEFLTQKLDERKEQIKALVVRHKGKDTLNILINHMVMDGADAKLTVKLIADSYTDILNGGSGDIPFKNGIRDDRQIFSAFDKKEKERVQKLISYSKKSKDKICFPFEKPFETYQNLKPFIKKMIISEEDFLRAKKRLKELNYTVNDLVVACFYRAIHAVADIPPNKALGVPCMVDLRRYMPNKESLGVTNLTSMIVCNIGKDIGGDIFETIEKVKEDMDGLKSNYPGLHGLPLLRFAFSFMPYAVGKFLVGTFFKNPLLGISNIGLIKESCVNFNGHSPTYLYYTGSIKYPPYYQLALTTYKNQITFTTALYGTDKDRKTAKELLEKIKSEFIKFSKGVK
ncbi:MAG: WS/DGAT domain-containing protein [Christensenellales bacterium]